jgi:hypothetical protein
VEDKLWCTPRLEALEVPINANIIIATEDLEAQLPRVEATKMSRQLVPLSQGADCCPLSASRFARKLG